MGQKKDLMDATQRRIFVSINPDLQNGFGHYLGYDRRIRAAAQQAGHELLILANQQLSPELQTESYIRPAFTDRTYDVLPILQYAEIERFRNELVKAIRKHCPQNEGTRYTLYMYMGSLWHLAGVALAAEQLNRPDLNFTVNIFHERTDLLRLSEAGSDQVGIYRNILQTIDRARHSLQLRLTACTESAIHTLRTVCDIEVDYLPMFSVSDLPPPAAARKPGPLRFYYPSNVQHDKGFDVLVAALEELARKDFKVRLSPEVEAEPGQKAEIFRSYELICRSFVSYPRPEQQEWLSRLPEHDGLRIVPGSLSDQEFTQLLEDADVLLIPYRNSAFAGRTSGIFADAVALHKPVITTRQTWAGEWTQRLENGLTFADASGWDLARAVEEMVVRFDQIKARTAGAEQVWLQENGIDEFYKFLKSAAFNSDHEKGLPRDFADSLREYILRQRAGGIAFYKQWLSRRKAVAALVGWWKRRGR